MGSFNVSFETSCKDIFVVSLKCRLNDCVSSFHALLDSLFSDASNVSNVSDIDVTYM